MLVASEVESASAAGKAGIVFGEGTASQLSFCVSQKSFLALRREVRRPKIMLLPRDSELKSPTATENLLAHRLHVAVASQKSSNRAGKSPGSNSRWRLIEIQLGGIGEILWIGQNLDKYIYLGSL